MAEEVYSLYIERWTYPPKQPQHLMKFAKSINRKITWKDAQNLIKKSNDTQSTTTNTEKLQINKNSKSIKANLKKAPQPIKQNKVQIPQQPSSPIVIAQSESATNSKQPGNNFSNVVAEENCAENDVNTANNSNNLWNGMQKEQIQQYQQQFPPPPQPPSDDTNEASPPPPTSPPGNQAQNMNAYNMNNYAAYNAYQQQQRQYYAAYWNQYNMQQQQQQQQQQYNNANYGAWSPRQNQAHQFNNNQNSNAMQQQMQEFPPPGTSKEGVEDCNDEYAVNEKKNANTPKSKKKKFKIFG